MNKPGDVADPWGVPLFTWIILLLSIDIFWLFSRSTILYIRSYENPNCINYSIMFWCLGCMKALA